MRDDDLPTDSPLEHSRRHVIAAVPLALLAATVAACGSDEPRSPRGATSSAVPGDRPGAGGAPSWPMYGHDFAQIRTNRAETSITRSTVRRLVGGWSIPDLIGVTGTPLVADGIAYFTDWKGDVWGVDVETGAKRWTTQVGGQHRRRLRARRPQRLRCERRQRVLPRPPSGHHHVDGEDR